MIIVEDPVLEFIPIEERKDGISLIVRVRNGEDYLRLAIISAIDQVDEIVVVFNESVDRTEEILIELEEEYPTKIKLFKYIPFVYPPHDNFYRSGRVRSDNIHALSHYYNFALSKTTYTYVCKHDDDNLIFPGTFQNLKERVEKNGPNAAIGLRGINLFDLNQNLYVNKKDPHTHGKDTIVFRYNDSCRYHQAAQFEVFKSSHRVISISVCFYHLKHCKKDRGLNNYNLSRNQRSRYLKIYSDYFLQADLVPLEKLYPNKPNPFDLGLYFIDECHKSYNFKRFAELEEMIKEKWVIPNSESDSKLKSDCGENQE